MSPAMDDLSAIVADRGWALLPGRGPDAFARVPAALGASVLLGTEVAVREGRALVTSDRALELHTDHHRARWIAWLCVAQTSEGGATRLADGRAALAQLSDDQRTHLAEIRLFEHGVFAADTGSHPLIEDGDGAPLLYASFWFDTVLDPGQRSALESFQRALHRVEMANFRLAPGDVLVIDNRRMLHGRTAITGSRDRLLIRHWLAREPLNPSIEARS